MCDLDDTGRLTDLGLRPSRVVTRDREVTQAWARELFGGGESAGVRWWSYNPDWGSIGLWNTAALSVTDIVVLTLDHQRSSEQPRRSSASSSSPPTLFHRHHSDAGRVFATVRKRGGPARITCRARR